MKIKGVPNLGFKLLIILFFLGIIVAGTSYAMNCYTYRDAIIQGASMIALIFTLLLMMFQYMDSRDPVITFSIVQVPRLEQSTNAAGLRIWFLRTFVQLENKSNYDTIVWLNLNLQIDKNKSDEAGEHYNGAKPWTVAATAPISGARFDLYSVINQIGNIAVGDIRVCVEIEYKGSFGRIIKKIPQRWHLDVSRKIWIYDV